VASLGVALLGLSSVLVHSPVQAGHSPGTADRIHLDSSTVLSGDLVFRRGRSMVSRAVLSLDGRSDFSHVGIAVRRGDDLRIVHAVPPEEGAHQVGVVVEPLELFLSPDHASAAAVYRPKNAAAGVLAAAGAWKHAVARTPFDPGFDLSTPRAVYCTELVWRVYLEADVDLAGSDFHDRYLLPSRLLESTELQLIKQVHEEAP
jgi:hypothetical protein